MSISFCTECDEVVEGDTFEQRINGVWTQTCRWCGAETIELPLERDNAEPYNEHP